MPNAKNFKNERDAALNSLNESVRLRYKKTDEVLNYDLVAEMPEENDSIRLSELLTGRGKNQDNEQPNVELQKNKVEKGKFHELRFEDKIIGFAMPRGEFSSDSDFDPSNLYSGAENCV